MLQRRSRETKDRIFQGLTKVISEQGIAGVTHRSVAVAAGVSLAATTRHFSDKHAMIREFSESVLAEYRDGFEGLLARIERGTVPAIRSIDDVTLRASIGGLVLNRSQSIAWCELMLHGGRSENGRLLAKQWYGEIDRIWKAIARVLGASPAEARFAVDRVVGNLFLLHPFNLSESQVGDIILEKESMETAVRPDPEVHSGNLARGNGKGADKILDAAIALLIADGPQAISFRRIADRAGVSRSAPAYHFPTVSDLLQKAQVTLFTRAKERYRDGSAEYRGEPVNRARLADLTTAVFMREAMQYQAENLAFYSVWQRAAADAVIRPLVGQEFLDQQTAWTVALQSAGAPPMRAFCMQAVFVGKLIRAISAGLEISDIASVREQFLDAMSINRYN